MVSATHGLLSSMLWKSVADVNKKFGNKEVLDHELLRYVDCISNLYYAHPFHSWDHACQVVLSATFLIKEYHKTKDQIGGSVDNNPFVRFITVFAALIHDVKHLGMPNAQLVEDKHSLSTVYQGSFLERQSIQVGLGIFIEEFPELSTFILQLCPEFLHLVTSAILATDVSSIERQKKINDRFERVVVRADVDVTEFEKTQTVVESVLLLADVGHCSQGFSIFLNWNAAFFHECLQNYRSGRGADPRPGWFKGQIGFVEGYIVPLTERCSAFVPDCELTEGARDIVRKWKQHGEEFTQQLIDESNLTDNGNAAKVESEWNTTQNEKISTESSWETRSLRRKPSWLFKRIFSRRSSSRVSESDKSSVEHVEKNADQRISSVEAGRRSFSAGNKDSPCNFILEDSCDIKKGSGSEGESSDAASNDAFFFPDTSSRSGTSQ